MFNSDNLKKQPSTLMSSLASGATGLALGAGGQLINNLMFGSPAEQQAKMIAEQIKGAKEMSDYNYQKQLDMWKATNFASQRAEMEKAGLSASLMYGGSGAGGGTTGSAGGGMPTGDTASAQMMARTQMMATMADIELKKATAEKTKVEAEKIAGVDTKLGETQIKDLLAGIESKEAQTELTKVQEKLTDLDLTLRNATFNDAVVQAHAIAHSAHTAMKIAQNEQKISDATVQQKIELINTELTGALLNNLAIKQGIEKSKAEINKMAQDILQGWEKLRQSGEEVNIKNFEAEIKAEYPSAWQIVGKSANDFFDYVQGLFGEKYKVKRKE